MILKIAGPIKTSSIDLTIPEEVERNWISRDIRPYLNEEGQDFVNDPNKGVPIMARNMLGAIPRVISPKNAISLGIQYKMTGRRPMMALTPSIAMGTGRTLKRVFTDDDDLGFIKELKPGQEVDISQQGILDDAMASQMLPPDILQALNLTSPITGEAFSNNESRRKDLLFNLTRKLVKKKARQEEGFFNKMRAMSRSRGIAKELSNRAYYSQDKGTPLHLSIKDDLFSRH